MGCKFNLRHRRLHKERGRGSKGSQWELNWTVVVSNWGFKWRLRTSPADTQAVLVLPHFRWSSSRKRLTTETTEKESLQFILLFSTLGLREMSVRNTNGFSGRPGAVTPAATYSAAAAYQRSARRARSVRSSLTDNRLTVFLPLSPEGELFCGRTDANSERGLRNPANKYVGCDGFLAKWLVRE